MRKDNHSIVSGYVKERNDERNVDRWGFGGGGVERNFAVENPATEEVIEDVPRARAEDVDLAVAAASAAFEDWWHLPGLDKAENGKAIPMAARS
ncbi:MAG: aldehyde dehydrogenase family protein [Acidobacteria bacterium]|nr:MAG: aldehyde dehydrogenase family protein [Acidobacteriota bacterium]